MGYIKNDWSLNKTLKNGSHVCSFELLKQYYFVNKFQNLTSFAYNELLNSNKDSSFLKETVDDGIGLISMAYVISLFLSKKSRKMKS